VWPSRNSGGPQGDYPFTSGEAEDAPNYFGQRDIRCPMLHINTEMLTRLDELESDLLDRRTRAEAENWAGEIEGIDRTLTLLQAERDDTQRRLRRPAVHLGIPVASRASHQRPEPTWQPNAQAQATQNSFPSGSYMTT